MTIASEYSEKWLQVDRPQPMFDKTFSRLIDGFRIDQVDVAEPFTALFHEKLATLHRGSVSGLDAFPVRRIIHGCTQFIDDVYMRHGRGGVQVVAGDYRYHWRLDPGLVPVDVETLVAGKPLIIALPFPTLGDVHPRMGAILDRAHAIGVPVHVDGAWLTCVRDFSFDFDHPAIRSIGFSLSKGLGLGWNRVGVRYARADDADSISIMNDFNMTMRTVVQVGYHFLKSLDLDFLWSKYEDAYVKVCDDFGLTPTKAIHLALRNGQPVGVRPLLRYLADK